MTSDKNSFEQHLQKLKAEYAAQLPQKIAAICADWEALCQHWQAEKMTTLHRNVHSLIGTSGTFGFSELSKLARSLEVLLKPLLLLKDGHSDIHPDTVAEVNSKCTQLLSSLKNLHTDTNSSGERQALSQQAEALNTATQALSDRRLSGTVAQDILIYYLDDEIAAPAVLVQSLISYGFKSKHFRTMSALLEATHHTPPSLIILDLLMPDISKEKVFSLARSIINMGIKVFILSGEDSFSNRLEAVRSGTHAFILKPPDIPALIGMIRNTLNLNINKPAHILIVDDQKEAAQFYSVILEKAGLKTTIETDPTQVLQQIAAINPDLLLLDLRMPHVNGDELAAVIRQHEKYQSIPILFLSAEAHPDIKTQLLEIGSDDLLSKDMNPDELVRHIRSRLDRSKILTALMYQDSLTGLLNHAQIQLAAERVFTQSRRCNQTFCVAMIDIDKFKSVNDTYGHLTGDRVIKSLAQLFQQRLRASDYIGRFGGEEFMLVLPDIHVNDAGALINNLRRIFFDIKFKENEQLFSVSFSAGIAENTGMTSVIEQIKFADEALYRAKNRGRNLVCTSLSGECL